jgi:hypothetical protein
MTASITIERCPMCQSTSRSSATPCTCGVEPGEEIAALRTVVVHRLARAWVSLGCGGIILFLAFGILVAHHDAWSSVAAWTAGLGGALVLRGVRVVSKTRRNLLAVAAQAALPAARIVP